MNRPQEIIEQAREVVRIERAALDSLVDAIDENFAVVVKLILESTGKVIITGIGKSGLVARKIAATLASTGTLAIFLHPTEGLHGDVGIVRKEDICLLLSKSGESEELLAILPVLKRIGATTVAITASQQSDLATHCDYSLQLGDSREAGLAGLTPTSSTTATMALGDALAVVLLNERKFQPVDFALLHPGGSLGKKLLLKVDDLMHTGERNPLLPVTATCREAVKVLTELPLGAVSLVDEEGKLAGIFTDGDFRRSIGRFGANALDYPIDQVMTKTPVVVQTGMLALDALNLMENRPSQIMVLPVVNAEQRPIGMLRVHDLLAAGLPSRDPNQHAL
ncbi:MAG: KpsF/GutQ family sugar-phosphate isomerase [bacterium]|nr:KpsF/GutQ family sugar-phosphate isomerase [bacterium]